MFRDDVIRIGGQQRIGESGVPAAHGRVGCWVVIAANDPDDVAVVLIAVAEEGPVIC